MDNRDDRNAQHRLDPKVGDYWHEMFSPIMVVVGRGEDTVIVCDKVKAVDDGWFWDVRQTRTLSLAEFSKRPTYGGVNQQSKLGDKCWCDVVPESQTEVRKLVISAILGDCT